ncbi:MAG: hypothetical protein KAV82_03710 [Phycisphaerae bacterium]|nr:hypothetical protein [Phycisphaerae bacterium]
MLVASGTLPAPIPAGEMPKAIREKFNDAHDRQALDSLDFILALGLTADQARAILRQHQAACRLHTQGYLEQAELQPLEIEAYTAFLEESRRNQGFSPEVEHHTAQIHHRAIRARDELAEGLNALAVGVWDVLTLSQRQIAADYKPNRKAVFERFAGPQERRKADRLARRRAIRNPGRHKTCDPQLEKARKKLESINQAAHPRPDVIARHLLTPAAAESLHQLAGVEAPLVVREAVDCRRLGTRDYPLSRCREDQSTLHKLRAEINNWNLANGMHFSRDQIGPLVELAERAEDLKTAQRRAKPRDRLPRKVLLEKLVELELAAESVLRPGQLEVLRAYLPCLIPPKNLKDPVRVGQASDGTRLANWLERARRKPQWRVERLIERMIEREIAHFGPMGDAALEQRRLALHDTVRRAAEMNDVEFALNKDELAQAIQPENRKEQLIADIEALRRERRQPGRTYRFLLNSDFAAVLSRAGSTRRSRVGWRLAAPLRSRY